MSGKARVIKLVKSHTDSATTYEIRVDSKNYLYCTCPAWRFSSGRNKDCKHLRTYRARLQKRPEPFNGEDDGYRLPGSMHHSDLPS